MVFRSGCPEAEEELAGRKGDQQLDEGTTAEGKLHEPGDYFRRSHETIMIRKIDRIYAAGFAFSAVIYAFLAISTRNSNWLMGVGLSGFGFTVALIRTMTNTKKEASPSLV